MKEKSEFKYLFCILFCIGLIWLRSSYGKMATGNFADNLGNVLTKTFQNNPYLPYKSFLQNFAIPNSQLFGQLVLWGEFATAVSICLSSLYLLLKNPNERMALLSLTAGLAGGVFLNINFWLAFSPNNPGTDNLNLLMIAIQVIGIYYLLKRRLHIFP